jgi:hypothetical protein
MPIPPKEQKLSRDGWPILPSPHQGVSMWAVFFPAILRVHNFSETATGVAAFAALKTEAISLLLERD